MNERKHITSREYILRAVVAAILIIVTFIAMDYVVYIGNDPQEDGYIKWFLDMHGWYIFAGVVVMFIPYEKVLQEFLKDNRDRFSLSFEARMWALAGVGVGSFLLTFMASRLAAASIPFRYHPVIFMGINAIFFILCLIIFPLFKNEKRLMIYVAVAEIFDTIVFYTSTIHVISDSYVTEVDIQGNNVESHFIYAILICYSVLISSFVYGLSRGKNRRDIIKVAVAIFIISVAIFGLVALGMGFIKYELPFWRENGIGGQYFGIGMGAFKSAEYIVALILFAVSTVFVYLSGKSVAKYSKVRVAVINWVTIMFLVFLVWQILEDVLQAACGIKAVDPVFNSTSIVAVCIVIRMLIIPVQPEEELEYKF